MTEFAHHSLAPLSAYDLDRTTDPSTTPVSAAELREHLRLDGTEQDTYLAGLIAAATEEVEKRASVSLITQTWTLKLDAWWNGPGIELPKAAPLQSVSSITYIDTDGNTQTLSTDVYQVDVSASAKTVGRVRRAYGQSLPAVRQEPGAVTIVYVAGSDNASDVSDAAKHAIKIWAAHLYANAELMMPGGMQRVPEAFEALVGSIRVRGAL